MSCCSNQDGSTQSMFLKLNQTQLEHLIGAENLWYGKQLWICELLLWTLTILFFSINILERPWDRGCIRCRLLSIKIRMWVCVKVSKLRYIMIRPYYLFWINLQRRAGFMVSAGITALLKKMDYKDVVVAIDGSVFRFSLFYLLSHI